MTDIKELHGLKVKAIAVSVPENEKDIYIRRSLMGSQLACKDEFGERVFGLLSFLPPGEWKVLGRANELELQNIKILTGLLPYHVWLGAPTEKSYRFKWAETCKKFNLTNELILYDTLG